MIPSERIRVTSAAEIDALVGTHLLGETPEVFWEHSHGLFQFATEEAAWQALRDDDYQFFLPEVEWTSTVVREVREFPAYCSDSRALWRVVGKASRDYGPLRMRQETGRWWTSFGNGEEVDGRTPAVVICLAALRAGGLTVAVDHAQVDAELNRLASAQDSENRRQGLDWTTPDRTSGEA